MAHKHTMLLQETGANPPLLKMTKDIKTVLKLIKMFLMIELHKIFNIALQLQFDVGRHCKNMLLLHQLLNLFTICVVANNQEKILRQQSSIDLFD